MKLKDKLGEKIQGTTQDLTYAYYRQGMPVAQIARERGIKDQTIYSHLAELYEQGHEIKIFDFMDKGALNTILDSLKTTGVPDKLKTLYERFNGKYEYHQLKLAIAHFKVNFGERGIIRYD
jgi:ATP-dependent DNA helicase RecQ